MAQYEAQCSKVGSFAYSQYFKLYVILTDGEVSGNYSKVNYNVFCQSSGSGSISAQHWKYFNLNGQEIVNITEKINVSSPNAYIHIASGTTDWIEHNSDGGKSIWFSAQIKGNTYGVSANLEGTFNLVNIPRYSEINSVSVQSMKLNAATIQYSVSRTANIYCSVDGMDWGNPVVYNTTSGTFTISGLSPNAQHSFATLVRAVDSGLDRISGTMYGTTLDIARINSLFDFEHGNNPVVNITNPANISNLNLVMNIGDVQILNMIVNTGNNEIIMTDSELDNLYKRYGSSNSLTASFTLSGNGYTDTKSCVITLTGNQKTIYIGTKRGKVFIGTKRGVIWQNVNGTWKRGG